ncbi:MFS transporter [Tsukamurella paurometabola]|uniref:Antiseptic resistance protein n=1 Tax=Tsukamurella paurometabola TaxID=2061 RepID=A0A3P8MDW0_TSUPA|nr:MFS transporter [Tsukamurella paurometabola]UEA82227.1 MFS transporter [Tsukamurella paurometabola]VDR39273.1 Antiseptic resistance protein [Tsukamurella paurometabola]
MPQNRNRARSPWAALTVLALAMLVIGLDTMVLTVALPSLARELGASTTALQWITTAYPLALGALMIPMGALGDRIGRVRVLSLALLGFGAASALCAFAGSTELLVAGRVLLGVCAAAAMPLSMGVLPTLFPDKAARERAMGVWMASSAAGMPLGPILGGVLLQHFWWGSVFLINVPIAVVAAVAVHRMIPESKAERPAGLDVIGVVTCVAGFGALVWAFTEAGASGWTSGRFLVLLGVAVAALALFGWRELTAERPLVRLTLLRRKGFLAGTVLASATMLLLASSVFQLAQVFSVLFQADSLGIGLRLLPVIAGLIVGARGGPVLVRRFGRRAVAAGSIGLLALTFAVQAAFPEGPLAVYTVTTVLLGLGLGGVMPLVMSLAMGDLDADDAGAGSALMQSIRQISSALGVAVFGSVVTAAYGERLGVVGLPGPLERLARDNPVVGVPAVRAADPGAIDGVLAAYAHGLAVGAVVGLVLSVVVLALCRLIPAESGDERDEAERGAAAARPA